MIWTSIFSYEGSNKDLARVAQTKKKNPYSTPLFLALARYHPSLLVLVKYDSNEAATAT